MRSKPDKHYCPNPKMFNNMTLYEMAYSMSDSNPQDAQEAMPYFIKWLLKDFAENYSFNEEGYSDEYMYNIAYFLMYNFINRESCSKVPEVFRTKLLKEIVNMNLNHDFYSLLNDIKSSTAELTKTIRTDDDNIHIGDNLQTNNLNEQRVATDAVNGTDTTTFNTTQTSDTDSSTVSNGEVVTDTDTTNSNTKTLGTKDKTTNNTTDTTTHNTTDSTQQTNRSVATDYPQSTVNTQTVGSWTYASGAQDQTGSASTSKTGTDATARTGTTDLDRSGTISDSGSGSVDDTTTTQNETIVDATDTTRKTGTETLGKVSNETVNSSTNNTGTVHVENSSSDERDIATDESWTGMSGFELNAAQVEIYSKHDNFYKELMHRFENCFISVYVDEDRDGWLDPSVNLLSQWEVQ